MVERVDCVVVGAGVVGLAVARALSLAGREVMMLEAEGAIGTGTSSRNSEVIHAGIYYPQGSLKAKLCVRGKELLYRYCEVRGVEHRRCGKLIVATSADQVQQLQGIQAKAAANGVGDLQWLQAAEAKALEPALQCEAALLSPSTGIVDSHGLMLSLQGDIENAGGMVVLHAPVQAAEVQAGGILLTMADGTQLQARTVVNAAGLSATALARRFEGFPRQQVPEAFFAKGNYFALTGRAPFHHLIYPVPEAAGLGVHLTLDLGGQAKFGPDCSGWTVRRICRWTAAGPIPSMPRSAAIGQISRMAPWSAAMPACVRRSAVRARPRPISGFKVPASTVLPAWCSCSASSRPG